MSVTGWKSPGTCANVDRDASDAWSNPDNVKASDDTYALVNNQAKDAYSDWLRCTNFSFSVIDLPSGATIEGIEVQIERNVAGPDVDTITDSAVYLRKTAGQTGDNKASAAYWPVIKAYATYGGAADDWNATLVDTDIRDSDFGVDISAYNTDAGMVRGPHVHHVQIRIHYSAESTIALDALTLASSVPGLTQASGSVSIAFDALLLSGSVPTATLALGSVSIAVDALTLIGAAQTLTQVSGSISVEFDTLTLTGSAESLTIAIVLKVDAALTITEVTLAQLSITEVTLAQLNNTAVTLATMVTKTRG